MWAVLALRPDPEPLEPVFLSLLCGVHSALGKLTLSSPSLGHPPPPGARQRRPPTRHHCPEARRPPHAGFGSQSCASVGRRCDSDALQSVWPRERAAGQRGQRSGHSPPPSPQRGLYSAPAGDRQQLPGLLRKCQDSTQDRHSQGVRPSGAPRFGVTMGWAPPSGSRWRERDGIAHVLTAKCRQGRPGRGLLSPPGPQGQDGQDGPGGPAVGTAAPQTTLPPGPGQGTSAPRAAAGAAVALRVPPAAAWQGSEPALCGALPGMTHTVPLPGCHPVPGALPGGPGHRPQGRCQPVPRPRLLSGGGGQSR